MKLLHGTVSPFVRKVMVTLHELGLQDRVALEPVTVSATAPSPTVVAHNPIGKIPTLILDNGEALYDSTVICEYLASLAGDIRLFPAAGDARWQTLRLNTLADGLVIAGVLARNELGREAAKRWDAVYQAQWTKVENCLKTLEQQAHLLADTPTMAEISVGCAVGWVDFRVTDYDWRTGRPRLAAWFDRIRERPSFQASAPRS